MLRSQFVEFCSCAVGFVRIGPRLDKFFLKIFIDHFVWSGRSRNGQDPVLHASFPFVDIWATHIGEGVGDLLPRIYHDWVCGIHELIEVEFVKETISLLLVPIEDRGFFPLE